MLELADGVEVSPVHCRIKRRLTRLTERNALLKRFLQTQLVNAGFVPELHVGCAAGRHPEGNCHR